MTEALFLLSQSNDEKLLAVGAICYFLALIIILLVPSRYFLD